MSAARCVEDGERLDLQGFPPGTHRPVSPLAAVQVSCLSEVLATQQSPDGTGRPLFCGSRGRIAAVDRVSRVVRMAMVNFMLVVLGGLFGGLVLVVVVVLSKRVRACGTMY
jgi:hypothetical protein